MPRLTPREFDATFAVRFEPRSTTAATRASSESSENHYNDPEMAQSVHREEPSASCVNVR